MMIPMGDERWNLPRVQISDPSLEPIGDAGGQHGWVWAVALPYRAITAPWSGVVMPAAPQDVREEEGRFEHQLGYYASLQSLLTYSFGWTRPDKGLHWWYTNGMPKDDDRFALISATWEHDGNLLGFLSWLMSVSSADLAHDTLGRWARNRDERPVMIDADWEQRLRRAGDVEPWNGGNDPLHLGRGSHISAPSHPTRAVGSAPAARLIGVDEPTRTATFVSDSVEGWYASLATEGDHLAMLYGDRSWHVDVLVKQLGFLGVYRRSRQTGLWFTGPHRLHVVGN